MLSLRRFCPKLRQCVGLGLLLVCEWVWAARFNGAAVRCQSLFAQDRWGLFHTWQIPPSDDVVVRPRTYWTSPRAQQVLEENALKLAEDLTLRWRELGFRFTEVGIFRGRTTGRIVFVPKVTVPHPTSSQHVEASVYESLAFMTTLYPNDTIWEPVGFIGLNSPGVRDPLMQVVVAPSLEETRLSEEDVLAIQSETDDEVISLRRAWPLYPRNPLAGPAEYERFHATRELQWEGISVEYSHSRTGPEFTTFSGQRLFLAVRGAQSPPRRIWLSPAAQYALAVLRGDVPHPRQTRITHVDYFLSVLGAPGAQSSDVERNNKLGHRKHLNAVWLEALGLMRESATDDASLPLQPRSFSMNSHWRDRLPRSPRPHLRVIMGGAPAGMAPVSP